MRISDWSSDVCSSDLVVHRDDDPFVVETGGAKIVDLGTAFNVVRRDRQTSVAVSEGIILYNPDRDKVRLVAGKGIEARDGDRTPPVVRGVDVANVGGWRSALIVYNGTPLSVVAEDLKRAAGMRSEEHTSELQSLMHRSDPPFSLPTFF